MRTHKPPIGTPMWHVLEHLYYEKARAGPLMEYVVREARVTGYFQGGYTEIRLTGKNADKYHDLVTEMLETAIRRVGNEYADMLFEYDQQRREAEKQCEQLAMEGMTKK